MTRRSPGALPNPSASFPETQTTILTEAADGAWVRFFQEYLAPCWHEIVLACRGRQLPLHDAADLLQELSVRLMRDGRFKGEWSSDGHGGARRGNIPRRFLAHRAAGLPAARFRTYLKQVIQNLIRERLRAQRRQPKPLGDDLAQLEPWVEDSISVSVDRHWVAQSLVQAARQLEAESRRARTRGQQRLFQVLYLSAVQGYSAATIAADLGLDRTTVAELVTRARQRFVEILGQCTGITSRAELKSHVAAVPEALPRALAMVWHETLQHSGKGAGT